MNEYLVKPENIGGKTEVNANTFRSTFLVCGSHSRKLAVPGLAWFVKTADLKTNIFYC